MSTTAPGLPLTVYTGATRPGIYSWSPFDIKIEARLRFSHRAYSVHKGSPPKGPRGKIPYARIGHDGGQTTQNDPKDYGQDGGERSITLGDSTLITRKLIALGELEDLNAKLSPVQKAQDLTIRALLEEKMYFIGVRAPIGLWVEHRHVYPDTETPIRSLRTANSQSSPYHRRPLSTIPYPIRIVVGFFLARKLRGSYYAQGIGRYTDEERSMFCEEAWTAFNDILTANNVQGDGKRAEGGDGQGIQWVLGTEGPTEADASLYGVLAGNLISSANPEMQRTIRKFPALVNYAERVHDTFFPDYSRWK
ncbi:MAG: hypothetical protein M1830_007691 [Pleopsidium flavum]|nr:MAG: hypothetical protein M1830_007691 [Pleopsidium flavum]